MEQKFSNNSLDLETLREFCKREGEAARWFAFVTEGCFKYVTHGLSDDREYITWFSFEGEFAGDYPACLSGRSSRPTSHKQFSG
jgi:hypothetical protein